MNISFGVFLLGVTALKLFWLRPFSPFNSESCLRIHSLDHHEVEVVGHAEFTTSITPGFNLNPLEGPINHRTLVAVPCSLSRRLFKLASFPAIMQSSQCNSYST